MAKKKFERVRVPECPWHQSPEMGYLRWHRDAEKRDAEGQKQKQCPVCGYWFWPDQFGVDPISKLIKASNAK